MNENEPQGTSDWLKEYGLNIEDRVSCDTIDCKNAAIYYSRVRCCGGVMLSCGPCYDKAVQFVMWMIHNDKILSCKWCHEVCTPKGWLSPPHDLLLET